MKISPLSFWLIILLFTGFIAVHNAFSNDTKGSLAGVDDVMRSLERYKGIIKIVGAVSEVYPKDNFIVLIDRREFKQCGKETCALLKMPVKWNGPMPSVRDIVTARGEIKENKGVHFFDAATLEKISQ